MPGQANRAKGRAGRENFRVFCRIFWGVLGTDECCGAGSPRVGYQKKTSEGFGLENGQRHRPPPPQGSIWCGGVDCPLSHPRLSRTAPGTRPAGPYSVATPAIHRPPAPPPAPHRCPLLVPARAARESANPPVSRVSLAFRTKRSGPKPWAVSGPAGPSSSAPPKRCWWCVLCG